MCGECAKPTPASQMYSQLSMVCMSSGLSCRWKMVCNQRQRSTTGHSNESEKQIVLTGPDFLLEETVKSGQNMRSCNETFDGKRLPSTVSQLEVVLETSEGHCFSKTYSPNTICVIAISLSDVDGFGPRSFKPLAVVFVSHFKLSHFLPTKNL